MASAKNSSTRKKRTTESLIAEFRAVHRDKYDYSKVKYIPGNRKVLIICPDHGEWSQDKSSHLAGRDCTRCAAVRANGATVSVVEYDGVKYGSLRELADARRVNYHVLVKRTGVKRMSVDEAMSIPFVDRAVVCDGITYKDKTDFHQNGGVTLSFQTMVRLLNNGMKPEDTLTYIPSHGHANGILYVITNKANGKQYIGITTETADKRLASHIKGAKISAKRNSNSLGAAILKHGVRKFKIEVIQHAPNVSELTRLEKEAIEGMGTQVPNGYNISGGGCIGGGLGKRTVVRGKVFKTQTLASEYLAEVDGIGVGTALNRIVKGRVDMPTKARLGMTKAKEIRVLYERGETRAVIAKSYNATEETIGNIVRHISWKEKAA